MKPKWFSNFWVTCPKSHLLAPASPFQDTSRARLPLHGDTWNSRLWDLVSLPGAQEGAEELELHAHRYFWKLGRCPFPGSRMRLWCDVVFTTGYSWYPQLCPSLLVTQEYQCPPPHHPPRGSPLISTSAFCSFQSSSKVSNIIQLLETFSWFSWCCHSLSWGTAQPKSDPFLHTRPYLHDISSRGCEEKLSVYRRF